MSDDPVKVRLLFVDEGSYHHEVVEIPSGSIEKYDRLIDCVREDQDVLSRLHIDITRLVSAYLTETG